MMRNPFIYGGLVFGDHFADRQTELSELASEMSNVGKVFLVSPRRMGKTCLLRNLQVNLKKLVSSQLTLTFLKPLHFGISPRYMLGRLLKWQRAKSKEC